MVRKHHHHWKLIKYDESLVPEGGKQVVCNVAGPFTTDRKDPAGYYFHLKQLKIAGIWEDASESESEAGQDTSTEPSRMSSMNLDDQAPTDVNWKGRAKKKTKVKKRKDDLYALLGLQNERWTATESQLKNAYRRVCLEHHPDKKLAGVTDEDEKKKAEDYFKQIQEAYGVLSDPAKRREFDSTDEFDDSLPSECAVEDFFKVFGPAFRRNARWSVDEKVPEFGDDATAYEEVDKFYQFWFTFKSWREFPHPDEEDVEGCESREHRRYVERLNSKLREKGKKEEGKRLRQFVEDAYRLDPRVQRKKEEDRLEKERKKQEKEEARRAAEAEVERKKQEEEAAKKAAEEEEKRKRDEEKKIREANKKQLKKTRQQLRMLCESDGPSGRLISEDDVDKLTSKLEQEEMAALCEAMSVMGITREAQKAVAEAKVQELADREGAEARAKEAQKKEQEKALKNIAKVEHQKKLESMREWNDEEIRLLDKAVNKYPQGTPKRWEQVAAYIRTRTLDEVLLMVKERQGMSASRYNKAEDFKAGQKKRAEVTSQADLRLHAFSDVDVNLAGSAALMVERQLTPIELAEAAAAAAGHSHRLAEAADASASSKPAAPAAAPKAAAAPAAPAAAAAAEKKPAAAAAAAAAAPAAAGADVWNEEQELALVKAMKQFGKELTDRWERVAGVVPGKSKAQCFKRFKELREVFRAKKGGAAGGGDGDE